MNHQNVTAFFNSGKIFLYDESDYENENSIIAIEKYMTDKNGINIVQVQVDDEIGLYLYFDSSLMNQKLAISKYNNNDYDNRI